MYKRLKPCPFCGGEGYINYERIPGEDKGCWAQVICKKMSRKKLRNVV